MILSLLGRLVASFRPLGLNYSFVLELLLLILAYFGLLTWLVSIAGRWLENHLRMPGYGQ